MRGKIREHIASKPVCHAWARSAGRQCRQTVVPGRSVCAYHGGHAGAPKGNANGLRHGRRSFESELEREKRKNTRIADKAIRKVASLIAPPPEKRGPGRPKRRINPEFGAQLLQELREARVVAEAWRDLAAQSREARLARKKAEAKAKAK